MSMKKTLSLLLVFVMSLVLFASCSTNNNPSQPESQEPTAEESDGQNPVMNFIGTYASGRCAIEIEADGDSDAKITVDWGNGAAQKIHWTMSGTFDPDTYLINYSNCKKTIRTFGESGEIEEETVEYENGFGRIQFYNDGTLAWQDELERENIGDMIFTFAK